MVNSIPLSILVGLLLGTLAGLGVGGGSLLMLWLTVVLQITYPTARAINLLFFLASAGGISLLRLKNGRLDPKNVLPAILSGCIFAALGAWLGKNLDLHWIQKAFGILLLVTGLRELFYRPRNAR